MLLIVGVRVWDTPVHLGEGLWSPNNPLGQRRRDETHRRLAVNHTKSKLPATALANFVLATLAVFLLRSFPLLVLTILILIVLATLAGLTLLVLAALTRLLFSLVVLAGLSLLSTLALLLAFARFI
jgi:hypothetical protein